MTSTRHSTHKKPKPYAVVVYAPGFAGREDSRHDSIASAQAQAEHLWTQYGIGLDSIEVEHTSRGTVRIYR